MNIANVLNNYKIKANINMLLDMWNESHRSYHNLDHYIDINRMIKEDYANNKLTMSEYEKLSIANLFHDIIYDPTRKDNEQKSAEFFISLCLDKKDKDILEIKQIILDTATHNATTPLSEKFNKYDMNIVERDFDSLLIWENGIHEEYKMYGNLYKTGRLQFLESLLDKYPLNSNNLLKLIEHVSGESNGVIEKKND
jgi:predicted metal-dependent HD superfamily phosphohydrolase